MLSVSKRHRLKWASLLSLLVSFTAALLPYAHCHETALHGRILTPHHPVCAQSIGHLFLLPAMGSHDGDQDATGSSHDHCIHFLTEDAGIGNSVPAVAGPTEVKFLTLDIDPLPCLDLPTARTCRTLSPHRPLDGFQSFHSGLSPPSRRITL